jgi:hypothetical protein
MKKAILRVISLRAGIAMLCVGAICAFTARAQQAGGQQGGGAAPSTRPATTQPQVQAQVQAQAQPQIEQQRREAQQEAERTLDKDAIAAIEATQRAIRALDQGNAADATSAIEQATGKINVLLARNPNTALIPVAASVDVIDLAPRDAKSIKAIAKAADKAVDQRDYPGARLLLQSLISEIRVRTFNVPLASYPAALQEAARLADLKKPQDAKTVLETALRTLAVVDKVTPLPIAVAQEAISEAQAQHDKVKDAALRLLATAREELDRAKLLGYAGNDPEYTALNQEVSEVERQIKGNENSASAFTRLKERVAAFFKRQSSNEKRPEMANR